MHRNRLEDMVESMSEFSECKQEWVSESEPEESL